MTREDIYRVSGALDLASAICLGVSFVLMWEPKPIEAGIAFMLYIMCSVISVYITDGVNYDI